MGASRKKPPLILRVGLALLFAAVLSMQLVGGIYARFYTSSDSSDGARVAAFAFTDNFESQTATLTDLIMSPGDLVEREIKVQNMGEVALRYTVSIDNLTKNLPLVLTVDKTGEVGCGETDYVVLSINWPAESNSTEYMGKTDNLRITVRVEQID
jgi:hypothetical protein